MIVLCGCVYIHACCTQSRLTLCDPMDCGPPGSAAHGISQARILEWVAVSFSGGSSWPGIKPRSPASQVDSLPAELSGNTLCTYMMSYISYRWWEDCCCSVAQLCLSLFDPMDCRMPGFPVLHHFLELAQTHVYWVSDAILPSYPLSSLSPPVFNLSQHQGLF